MSNSQIIDFTKKLEEIKKKQHDFGLEEEQELQEGIKLITEDINSLSEIRREMLLMMSDIEWEKAISRSSNDN